MQNNYNETRKIDVTNHIEKKGKFSYLSWSVMVDELKKLDPNSKWDFKEPLTLPDGSMMVFCVLESMESVTNMQMPVLDHKNNAIKNPTAMHLNTAMQRCLAKAISCHTGIGLHVYQGEDLPPDEPKEPVRMFEAHDIQVLEDGIEECQSIEELKAKWTTIHSYHKAGRLQQHDYESLEKVKDRKKGEL